MALIAILFNATVSLWHAPARARWAAAEAALAQDLTLICHGAGPSREGDASGDPVAPPSPSKNVPDCPVCLGLAAIGAAILKDAIALAVPHVVTAVRFGWSDTRGATRKFAATRNRGPPSIA